MPSAVRWLARPAESGRVRAVWIRSCGISNEKAPSTPGRVGAELNYEGLPEFQEHSQAVTHEWRDQNYDDYDDSEVEQRRGY